MVTLCLSFLILSEDAKPTSQLHRHPLEPQDYYNLAPFVCNGKIDANHDCNIGTMRWRL
jgi:hypothetical protein